jgi:BT4734-like, N-terminal domain
VSGITVSWVQSANDVETRQIALEKVIYAIRTGGKKLKGQITQIRNKFEAELALTGDYKAAKEVVGPLKKQLPGVLFSAKKIARRENKALKEHSGLFCADQDGLGGAFDEIWTQLTKSPHVMLVFRSPCGDGIKTVFKVVPDISRHRDSFRAIEQYVLKLTGKQIDEKCKDEARMNFLSFDPQIYVNLDALVIEPLPPLPKREYNSNIADLGLRQRTALEMLGAIDWDSDSHGFLPCPGKHLHSTGEGERDCEIHLDGAPTLHCFHNHCSGILAGLNHELRSRIAKGERENAPKIKVLHEDDEDSSVTSLVSPVEFYPPPLLPAAFHGLSGDFVHRVLPHTEANEPALLFAFHIGFGNLIGRTAHGAVGPTPHFCNEYVVTVGPTSKARKGDAWWQVRRLFKAVDSDWLENTVPGGLSTGEGLIWAVRDSISRTVKNKKSGLYETEIVDPGVDDKRLFVIESEFARVLACMERDGNTLSATMRAAWDCLPTLRPLVKTSPTRATGVHFSMLGNITREELRMRLPTCEYLSGYGNRILWPAVRRWQELPEGGELAPIADLVQRVQEAAQFAKAVGEVKRDPEARELWASVYHDLSADKPGLLGAITARAEAHAFRLQIIYALLDRSPVIRVEHVQAALAAWHYCEHSARWTFESGTGNRHADKILAELKVRGDKGMTRWAITRDVFKGNITKAELDNAFRQLHHLKLANVKPEPTATKPAERWFHTKPKPYEVYEVSPQNEQKPRNTSYTSSSLGSEKASSAAPTGEMQL